jgi:hypothetical protein
LIPTDSVAKLLAEFAEISEHEMPAPAANAGELSRAAIRIIYAAENGWRTSISTCKPIEPVAVVIVISSLFALNLS